MMPLTEKVMSDAESGDRLRERAEGTVGGARRRSRAEGGDSGDAGQAPGGGHETMGSDHAAEITQS
jgi:hypothetical protein